MRGWPRGTTADRVLAGALVTRRHFLKGAAILGVAVAVVPRVLVQVPESYLVAPDDDATHVAAHISDLSALLKKVYGPGLEQQRTLAAKMYVRFNEDQIRHGAGLSYVRWERA